MAPSQDHLQASSRLFPEQDALARPKPPKRYPDTFFSTDGRRDSARQSRNLHDSGQRRVTRPVEVSSERMRPNGESGWSIRDKGQAMFVPDSQWASSERHGREDLYCASLNVFTYLPMSSGDDRHDNCLNISTLW
jgi:hypothetical protein